MSLVDASVETGTAPDPSRHDIAVPRRGKTVATTAGNICFDDAVLGAALLLTNVLARLDCSSVIGFDVVTVGGMLSCSLYTGRVSPNSVHSEYFPRRIAPGSESDSTVCARWVIF